MAPKVCRKTSEDHFFGGHTTKTVGKICTTTFWASLGNLGKNPLHPQTFACFFTYDGECKSQVCFEKSKLAFLKLNIIKT